MTKDIIIIILSLYISSCANFSSGPNSKISLKRNTSIFSFTDSSGDYSIRRTIGFKSNSREFVVKSSMYPKNKIDSKPIEQSVSISTLGRVGKNLIVLRPKISNFAVWFNSKKEKYFTEIKINTQKKTLDVVMESPEKKWNGTKSIPFPKGSGVYCFFEQLTECISVTGFFDLVSKKQTGSINFHIVWEGYPYIHHSYQNMKEELFSLATLEYSGIYKEKYLKFSLTFNSSIITYIVNSSGELIKKFWIAEGLSMNRVKIIENIKVK